MKSKLDPEGLGIILLGQFLLEFFPDQVLHVLSVFYAECSNTFTTFEVPLWCHSREA